MTQSRNQKEINKEKIIYILVWLMNCVSDAYLLYSISTALKQNRVEYYNPCVITYHH